MSKLDRDSGYSAAGRSLLEMITEDLDDALDALMIMKTKDRIEAERMAETVGYLRGLTRALATIIQPYDVDAGELQVRADAMRRWETRKEEVL